MNHHDPRKPEDLAATQDTTPARSETLPPTLEALLEMGLPCVQRYLRSQLMRTPDALEEVLQAWRVAMVDPEYPCEIRTWLSERPAASPASFCFWKARSTLTTYRRKHPHEASPEGVAEQAASDPAMNAVTFGKRAAAMRRAVAQLSTRDREILVLHDSEGLTFPECAEVLDEPEGCLRTRRHRALRRVRVLMADEGFSVAGS